MLCCVRGIRDNDTDYIGDAGRWRLLPMNKKEGKGSGSHYGGRHYADDSWSAIRLTEAGGAIHHRYFLGVWPGRCGYAVWRLAKSATAAAQAHSSGSFAS